MQLYSVDPNYENNTEKLIDRAVEYVDSYFQQRAIKSGLFVDANHYLISVKAFFPASLVAIDHLEDEIDRLAVAAPYAVKAKLQAWMKAQTSLIERTIAAIKGEPV